MSFNSIALLRREPAVAAALAVAAGSAATILGAWYFQIVVGLAPCPLCLEQRIPHYVAIPLALVVAYAARREAPRGLVVAGLGLLALAMLIGAGLATYHAGIEWKWWPGPQDCSGPLRPFGSAKEMLKRLEQISIVRCDDVGWRFLGLSLAGYNVLISLALAAIAIWGIVASGRTSAALRGARRAAA